MNKKYLAFGLVGLGLVDLLGNGVLSWVPGIGALSNTVEAALQVGLASLLAFR